MMELRQTKKKQSNYIILGAHYWEPATPIISQCNGIFTKQYVLRYFCREIGQFQSTRARFGKHGIMLACQQKSVLVAAIGH